MDISFTLIGVIFYVGFNAVAVAPTTHHSLQKCEEEKKKLISDLTDVEGRGLGTKKKATLKLSCVEETKNERKTTKP